MSKFWKTHQVGGPYTTLEESEAALAERAETYPTLHDLMPVDLPGETILDYGCGPGHDTVLFLKHGADHVYYADTSPMAHRFVRQRLGFYGFEQRATPAGTGQPFYVGHVHCAGVLHHIEEPLPILRYLRRVLKNGGEARVMIYDGDRSEHTQSKVPVTYWWGEAEFTLLAEEAGFDADYLGSYECSAKWRPNCFAACYRLT